MVLMKKRYIYLGIIVLALLGLAGYLFFNNQSATAPVVKNTNTSDDTSPAKTDQNQTTVPNFDKSQYSLTNPTSKWLVVNKTRPLQPKDYAPTDLVSVGGGQTMRSEAAVALGQLQTNARQAGLIITAASGYRSYNTQVQVYNNEVQAYGQAVADSESARPGTSEHQTGWAVDVAGGGCSVDDCFANTAEGKWVALHAAEYGFIVRYPEGKQNVTGYRYEPWHLRYIGSDLSQEMAKQNIKTLEEFFGLPAAPDYLAS